MILPSWVLHSIQYAYPTSLIGVLNAAYSILSPRRGVLVLASVLQQSELAVTKRHMAPAYILVSFTLQPCIKELILQLQAETRCTAGPRLSTAAMLR